MIEMKIKTTRDENHELVVTTDDAFTRSDWSEFDDKTAAEVAEAELLLMFHWIIQLYADTFGGNENDALSRLLEIRNLGIDDLHKISQKRHSFIDIDRRNTDDGTGYPEQHQN